MKHWKTKSGYQIILIVSGRSNVFLLTDGNSNILIDTSYRLNKRILLKRLKSLGIHHIDFLILTHTHFDHAANARIIKEKFNAVVIVSKFESSDLASGENIMPEGTNFFTRLLVKLFSTGVFPDVKYEPCQFDLQVDSFLDLWDYGFNAQIIHTPGHTIGSISIVVDNEIAIVGDTMFGVFPWSVFPPFANDVKLLITSWEKLLDTNCSLFLPSHGTANTRSLVQKNYTSRLITLSNLLSNSAL